MMEKPDIGSLRHRLMVEAPEPGVPDGAGGQAVVWQERGEVWASVEPVTSSTGPYADRQRQETTHKVRVRFRDDIRGGMRLRFGGRILAITGVINVQEQDEFLLLSCKEEI